MPHIKNKAVIYMFAIILIIVVILIFSRISNNYNSKLSEIYLLDKEDLINDGGFENFNQTVEDCCTTHEKRNEGAVFVSRSSVSFGGKYSLNLTSSNHCACINKVLREFNIDQKYVVSFYYKGDNPRICIFIEIERVCLVGDRIPFSTGWKRYSKIFNSINYSTNAEVYLYTDSTGRTYTNLYDDLQVHKLMPMNSKGPFNENETYIIKTKADNNVNGEMISDVVDGEAYFMVKGEPIVTIKFPWTEVVIIMLMLFVIIRLLFKKQISEFEREIAGEAKDIARDIRNEIKDIKESLSEKDSGNDTHEKEEPENIQKTTAEKD